MKQAKTKLPSGEYCFQEVPGDAKEIMTYYKEGFGKTYLDWLIDEDYSIPKIINGHYQLHGSDPLNLTEDEAAQVVEPLFTHEEIYEDGKYRHELNLSPMPYKNYLWPGDGGEYSDKKTALESYASLLAANGHKVGECVILKKNPIRKSTVIFMTKTISND